MRLGDYIDAYCSRCRRLTDHNVVALSGDKVSRVRCRTCDYEHSYRPGAKPKEMTAQEAFQKVLASVMGIPDEPEEIEKKPRKKPPRRRP